jgi:hypothetical protein
MLLDLSTVKEVSTVTEGVAVCIREMRKGNGNIGNFVNWAESRYGGGARNEKQSVPQAVPPAAAPLPQPVLSYDLRNNRIYPDQNQEANEISQAKLRIARAREENLALKRIIVQKNLQNKTTANIIDQRFAPAPSSSSKQGKSYQEPTSSPMLSAPQETSSQPPYQMDTQSQPHRSMSREKPRDTSPSPSIESTHSSSQAPSVPLTHQPPRATLPATPLTQPHEAASAHSPPSAPSPLSPSSSLLPPKQNQISKKKEKKLLRKEKAMEQRDLLSQSIADLQRFSNHLDAAIDDNTKLLLLTSTELASNSDSKSSDQKMVEKEREKKKKQQKAEEKQRRQKLKLQMDSLLRGQVLNILPLWRHRLRGNMNPKPEEILRGKSLFRVACLMVMQFYVKPHLAIQRRKAQTRSSEMDSMLKSLLLFIDNTGHWLGKLVKLPLSSIIQVSRSLHATHPPP